MSGALLRRSRLLCGDVAVRAVDNAVFKVLFAPPRDFDFVPLFLRAAVVYALKARAFRERAVANACHVRGNLHRLKVLVQRKRAFSDFRNAVGDFERGQRLGVHIVFANQYHALRFHEAAKLFIHRAPLCKRSVVEYTRKVLAVFETAANARHARGNGHALKARAGIKHAPGNARHAFGDGHALKARAVREYAAAKFRHACGNLHRLKARAALEHVVVNARHAFRDGHAF